MYNYKHAMFTKSIYKIYVMVLNTVDDFSLQVSFLFSLVYFVCQDF